MEDLEVYRVCSYLFGSLLIEINDPAADFTALSYLETITGTFSSSSFASSSTFALFMNHENPSRGIIILFCH